MRRPIVLLMLVLGLIAVSCGDDDTSVFDLGVGDCFNDEPGAGDEVTEVPVVPCSEPHDNEIYYEYQMTDAVFPGDEAAVESGGFRCLDEFEGFVGADYLDSELDLFPITPTAGSWAEGDRTVYCALYALDLSKLTGSMRGSGR